MHFNTVLGLVGVDPHVVRSLIFLEFGGFDTAVDLLDRLKDVTMSSYTSKVPCHILSTSRGRGPKGVSYVPHGDRSHPSIDLWCDGPRMKTRFLEDYQMPIQRTGKQDTYIPVVSILLYAQADTGPEYEYPACLIARCESSATWLSLQENRERCDYSFTPLDRRFKIILCCRAYRP